MRKSSPAALICSTNSRRMVASLGHVRVLLHHGNELPDVGFLLLLFIVTGQLDKPIIGQLAGNVVLRELLSRVNFKKQFVCRCMGR